MSLNKAIILSSENDASVKQEQNTNVEIKIKPQHTIPQQAHPVYYPNIPQMNPQSRDVNFTIPEENSQYQFQPPTNNLSQDRGIADLGNEIEDLTVKNKFLELLVEMYSENPLKINSYVVCKSSLLMNMIKLLTGCDKVDFVIEDDEPGCCLGTTSKFIKIDKIIVTKDGKSE